MYVLCNVDARAFAQFCACAHIYNVQCSGMCAYYTIHGQISEMGGFAMI